MATFLTIASTVIAVILMLIPAARFVVGKTQTKTDDDVLNVVETIAVFCGRALGVATPAPAAPEAPTAGAPSPLLRERADAKDEPKGSPPFKRAR